MPARIEHICINGKEQKLCTKCKEYVEITLFSNDKHRADKLNKYCRPCLKIISSKWLHSEKGINYRKAYYKSDAFRNSRYKNTFSISLIEYEKMIKVYDNNCYICRKKETAFEGKTGITKRLSIDHDHKTGNIRGLLCTRCNTALGLIKDDIETAKNIIEYLTNFHKML